MTILDLKEDIVNDRIEHVYVFSGTELGIMKIYLAEMSNKLSLPLTRMECLARVYDDLGDSLFGASRQIYVVRGDKDISKLNKTLSEIEHDLGDSYLVLLYDKLDTRLNIFKELAPCSVGFVPLSLSVLISYIRKTCPLKYDYAEKLVTIVNSSYDLAMLECDKINQYADSTKKDVDTVFAQFLRDGYDIDSNQNVYDFVEKVLSKSISSAYDTYLGLREQGIDTVTILGALYTSMKNLLLVQICEGDVCEVTGLSKGVVYYASKNKGKYSDSKLVEGVRLIADVTDKIKSGLIDEQYAIPYVLVSLC